MPVQNKNDANLDNLDSIAENLENDKNNEEQDSLVENNENEDDNHDEIEYFDDIGSNENEHTHAFVDEQFSQSIVIDPRP